MVSFQGWTADPPPVLCDLEALSYSPPTSPHLLCR